VICFCVLCISEWKRSEKRGIVLVSFPLQPMVQSWLLLQWGEFMVAVAAAIGLCYGVCTIAVSTGGFWR